MARGKIQSYRDLEVWQKGMALAEVCYRITKTFPKEEVYGMVRALLRALHKNQ
ncbi:MAG: four helix bundle protein [Cyanobacteria bacterium J06635_15]